VLELVGLTSVAGRRVGGFSLGMYQRLGIAAALLGDPRILLFDEPVNGLDPEGIRWIRSLLKQLAGEGRTILLSSHLMSEMEETADHVIVISRGRLIADASIGEFTQRSSGGHVRVVSPQRHSLVPLLEAAGASVNVVAEEITVTGIEAPRIGQIAAAHRIELHELSPRRATLEAAFMELTEGTLEYHATLAATARLTQADRPLVEVGNRS
jgi:ABC-2 type transport system ATP-binding protein